MIKKLLALITGLILIATHAYGYLDLTEDSKYYDEITYLCNQNVFTGYDDGAFLPDGGVSKEEFAAIICRIMNIEPEENSDDLPFSDVSKNNWARGYISALAKRNIYGFQKGKNFNPKYEVSGEYALMVIVDLTNQLEPQDINLHQFLNEYKKKATELGIEYPENLEKPITRAELAHMIYSAMDVQLYGAFGGVKNGTIRENIQQHYEFKDKGIEYLCSEELCKKPEDIKLVDLKEVREINAYNLPKDMYVESLEDLVNMPGLESVILTSQKITDISPLSKIKDDNGNYITEFFEIDIYDNPIKDVSCLKEITVQKPISFPYERNDNKAITLSVEEYCEMMEKVYAVTESEEVKNASTEDKLRAAHDAIINSCTYTGEGSPSIRTPYGVIVKGKALCEGYARAFKLFCDVMDIENHLVSGTVKISENKNVRHMWNEVVVDGNKKIVDVTNDDVYNSPIVYTYFLKDEVKSLENGKYEPVNTDRFSYIIEKTKDKMFVTVTYSTFKDVDKMKLKIVGTSEQIVMEKVADNTWEYTYEEDTKNYFKIERTGVTTNRNGIDFTYSGLYRREIAIDVYETAGTTEHNVYRIEHLSK